MAEFSILEILLVPGVAGENMVKLKLDLPGEAEPESQGSCEGKLVLALSVLIWVGAPRWVVDIPL